MSNNNDTNIRKILGSNIKQIRTLEGISQEELAARIGKSSHFISVIERGESGLSLGTVIDICKALNTDTNSIFAGTIDNSNVYRDSILNKSFETFTDKDRDMVEYLINYIVSSRK